MNQFWISLKDIPAEGKELIIDNQDLWLEPIKEFALPYSINEDISVTIYLNPQEDGCLVRGQLTGSINLPCDRCMGDATLRINQQFDEFFTLDEELREDDAEQNIRHAADGITIEIELAGLLWEEFIVSLPVKPLCGDDCQGLCVTCGANLNAGDCECDKEELDPRMAALRGLKVNK